MTTLTHYPNVVDYSRSSYSIATMATLTATRPAPAAPSAALIIVTSAPEAARRQWYDDGMTPPAKRKVSLTLDADIVAAIEADEGTTLSAEVNAVLRAEIDRRLRNKALGEFLDRLAAERGALDSPEDEAEIRRYMRALGARPDELELWDKES
jgi:uncharacterized protein (DUF4415 family)